MRAVKLACDAVQAEARTSSRQPLRACTGTRSRSSHCHEGAAASGGEGRRGGASRLEMDGEHGDLNDDEECIVQGYLSPSSARHEKNYARPEPSPASRTSAHTGPVTAAAVATRRGPRRAPRACRAAPGPTTRRGRRPAPRRRCRGRARLEGVFADLAADHVAEADAGVGDVVTLREDVQPGAREALAGSSASRTRFWNSCSPATPCSPSAKPPPRPAPRPDRRRRAALLVDHVLPAVGYRQWVLSFPGPMAVRL
jgi:hypothetical protein